jgi:hypothetical protein
MKRVCHEVKTSRGDFLSELKHPIKRRIGMRYSNEFYFVTPVHGELQIRHKHNHETTVATAFNVE